MAFFNHKRLLLEPHRNETCCYTSCPEVCSVSFPPPLDHQKQHVPPLVIIIVSVLATCFLLLSYYAIIVKYCSCCKNSRRPSHETGEDSRTHEDLLDEEHGPVHDHHVWYITTVGLEESIINSISVFKYKKGEKLVEGNDCSVCLSEFKEDETLRLLPKCSHAFHLPCIDTWLRSHTNCPLCRAPIVGSPSTPTPSNLNDSRPQEEPQMGLYENREDGEGDISGERKQVDRRRDMEIPTEDETSNANYEFQVENEMQKIRRSISMDFMGNSSKGRSLHKVPVSMKRSLSSGGKNFLSKHRRNRSSILPL